MIVVSNDLEHMLKSTRYGTEGHFRTITTLHNIDLIDRVPDELWMEVRDIVQEIGIKTIPMEKKCKKAKWLSREALQIVVKRRKVKRKGERERYKHLNAEFQRIARRDKKAFLSEQYKDVEWERLEIS